MAFRGGHAAVVSYLRSCGVTERIGEKSVPAPKKKPARFKRLTPMRVRAERVGVLDRYKDTPPDLRQRVDPGSPAAKKELQAIHKHNHQVVDRAEVASDANTAVYRRRLSADAESHRKRKRKLEDSYEHVPTYAAAVRSMLGR